MARYDFICEHCGKRFELTQSMKEQLPEICPTCGQTEPDFHQVYQTVVPVLIEYGNPKTIGQQAEINAKRLGKEQMQKKVEANEQRLRRGGKLPKGATRYKPESDELPWYRSGKVPGVPRRDKPLNMKKIKNAKKFIETGKES